MEKMNNKENSEAKSNFREDKSKKQQKWYIWYSFGTYTDREGPYSWTEIKEFVRNGQLKETDHLWLNEEGVWKEVRDFGELKILLAERKRKIQEEKTKKRILVIEDDPTLSELLKNILEEKGYSISLAPDGTAGIRQAYFELPDLIILDVNIPKVTGWEVCKRLKRDDHTRDIPIVFLTARDQMHHKLLGIEYGANYYLTKPFDLNQLEEIIHKLLSPSKEK